MGFGWLGLHRRVYCGAISTISRNWPTLSESKAPRHQCVRTQEVQDMVSMKSLPLAGGTYSGGSLD